MPEPLEIQAAISGADQIKLALADVERAERAFAGQTEQAMDKAGTAAEDLADKTKQVGDASTDAATKSERASDRMKKGHKDAADDAGKHKDQVGLLGKIYENLGTQATGWVTGMAGLSGVLMIVRQLTTALERLRDLEKELSEHTQGVYEGVHALAQQMGDLSAGGFQKALGLATDLGAKGGINNLAASANLATSLLIAYGSKEGLEKNQPQVDLIAKAVGALHLQGEEPSTLIEMLETMKVLDDPKKLATTLGKLQAAQDMSRSKDFGPFATEIVQKGGTSLLQAGMNFDEFLGLAVKVRELAPNEAMAGTILENLSGMARGGAGGEKIRQYLQAAAYEKMLREKMTPDQANQWLAQEATYREVAKHGVKTPEEDARRKAERLNRDKAFAEEKLRIEADLKSAKAPIEGQLQEQKAIEDQAQVRIKAIRADHDAKVLAIREENEGKKLSESKRKKVADEIRSLGIERDKALAPEAKMLEESREFQKDLKSQIDLLEKPAKDKLHAIGVAVAAWRRQYADEDAKRGSQRTAQKTQAKQYVDWFDKQRSAAFVNMDINQRVQLLTEVMEKSFTDKELEAELLGILGGVRGLRVREINTPQIQAKGEAVKAKIKGLGPEYIQGTIGQWKGNWLAEVNARKAMQEAMGTGKPAEEHLYNQMMEEAKTVAKEIEDSGNAPWSWSLMSDESRMEAVMADILRKRAMRRAYELRQAGKKDEALAIDKSLMALDFSPQRLWGGESDRDLRSLALMDRSFLAPITAGEYQKSQPWAATNNVTNNITNIANVNVANAGQVKELGKPTANSTNRNRP